MRILIVTDAWHPQINGVVRTIEYMQKYLTAFGHEVILETPELHHSFPMPTYKEIRLSLFNPYKMYKKFDHLNIDALHIATEGPLGICAARWAHKRGHQYTTAFHTMLPEYVKKRFSFIPLSWLWKLEQKFHQHAQICFVPTQSVADILKGHNFTNTQYWSRGVDTELFYPMPKQHHLPSPVWLFTGRIATEKNIQAFLDLDLEGTKLIVGDGPDRNRLEKQYPDVRFVGAQTGSNLAQYYNEADVFVFPSLTDTFGLVILEALACAKPVAAYPVTGPKDIIQDHPIGILHSDLKVACQKALFVNTENCQIFAQSQSWEKIIKQFVKHSIDLKGNLIIK